MRSDLFRLIVNLIVLAIISIVGYIIYSYYFKEKNAGLQIDETPIHIESIKTIAEISTVSYKDEVVIDTVEFYIKKSNNQESENEWMQYKEWLKKYLRNVKRRLTLIIHGEVKFGLDLTNKNYQVDSNADTIWICLPEPKILDVIITPSKTEIFQESGSWTDDTRKKLEEKAKKKLIQNASMLKLKEKSRINAIRLFKSLIQTEKKLIINFDHE